MSKNNKNKVLEELSDDQKHDEVKSPEEKDEESMEGSMPETGSDRTEDLDLNLKEEGIYEDADVESPNGPPEVSIKDQIEKNNEA